MDNASLSRNLINNLHSNIVFHDAIQSLKFHRDNVGYTDGRSIAVSTKSIRNFLSPKKILEQKVDHAVRHELEHVAMARFTQLDSDDKIKRHVEQNIEKAAEVFGITKPTNIQPFISEQKDRLKRENKDYGGLAFHAETGVSGRANSPFNFGSTPLNEGITEMKINMMDDYANRDGYYFKSGYNRLEVKIAKHMSKIIGGERFLKMHQNGDFVGITRTYQEAMGRDYEYMREFYLELDKPHGVPIEQKMFGSIGKQVGMSVRDAWRNFQPPSKQKAGSDFVRSFLE